MGFVPERRVIKLEFDGLAKVVRHKKGRIARAVMYKRPGDPVPTTLRDHMGKAYSFRQHLDDGHRPWAMKPLGAPFRFGSWLKLRCVFAMQIGSLSNPWRVYTSICFSASGEYSTPEPPYISRTMISIFSLMLFSSG